MHRVAHIDWKATAAVKLTMTPAPTSKPSKARKSSDAYVLFDPCAGSKSSKAPSDPGSSKASKCKSSKAAPDVAPVTGVADPTSTNPIVEIKEVRLNQQILFFMLLI